MTLCREKKIRCLIVEDDESLRQIMEKILRDVGLVVFGTDDGRQAVLLHSQEPFDLMILNWSSKIFNGNQIMEAIQDTGKNFPKIIAMTGTETISMHSPVPLAGFLFEPFNTDHFLKVVWDAIGDK
jgi:two-component system response regulator AdeR